MPLCCQGNYQRVTSASERSASHPALSPIVRPIGPAAQGGHRETDLAMLALFGCPCPDHVLDGYQRATP